MSRDTGRAEMAMMGRAGRGEDGGHLAPAFEDVVSLPLTLSALLPLPLPCRKDRQCLQKALGGFILEQKA